MQDASRNPIKTRKRKKEKVSCPKGVSCAAVNLDLKGNQAGELVSEAGNALQCEVHA